MSVPARHFRTECTGGPRIGAKMQWRQFRELDNQMHLHRSSPIGLEAGISPQPQRIRRHALPDTACKTARGKRVTS